MILRSAPSNPNQVSTLPSATNLLHVSVQEFHGETPFQLLLASTADRNLHLVTTDNNFSIYKSLPYLQDSPILSCISFGEQGMKTITTGMSGQVVLYDHKVERVLDIRNEHQKYVVRVATWNEIVVTAGWDNKVFLYRATDDFSNLGNPVAALTLSTNPESITFVEHPDSDCPILLVTRRDSTSLYYYSLGLELLGSQNLAPHSNSWITCTCLWSSCILFGSIYGIRRHFLGLRSLEMLVYPLGQVRLIPKSLSSHSLLCASMPQGSDFASGGKSFFACAKCPSYHPC